MKPVFDNEETVRVVRDIAFGREGQKRLVISVVDPQGPFGKVRIGVFSPNSPVGRWVDVRLDMVDEALEAIVEARDIIAAAYQARDEGFPTLQSIAKRRGAWRRGA